MRYQYNIILLFETRMMTQGIVHKIDKQVNPVYNNRLKKNYAPMV